MSLAQRNLRINGTCFEYSKLCYISSKTSFIFLKVKDHQHENYFCSCVKKEREVIFLLVRIMYFPRRDLDRRRKNYCSLWLQRVKKMNPKIFSCKFF